MLSKRISPAALWLIVALVGCGSEPSAAEYLERARVSESEGKLRTASIEVRNALKGDADNRDARLLLGSLQLRTGNPAGAEKELNRARELGADDVDTLPSLAVALLQQSKFDELKALDGDGLPAEEESSLLAARAYAHIAADDIDAARADGDRALLLDSNSTNASLVLARLDAIGGDVAGAADRLRATLETDPENIDAWELLGDIEREVGRGDEAIAAYDEAVTLSDRAFQPRLKRAQMRLARGEKETVLADLDALTQAGVKLPAIDLARGQLDLGNGDLSDAQLRFENALKSEPDYSPAQGGLALTHLALGNVGQAEQYGKQMMASTNDSDGARRLLGAIRLENGRYALAAETVEPIVRTRGAADPFAARLMSAALLKQGRHDDAIEQMIALSRTLPPNVEDSVDSPLVLARAPSKELLDDIGVQVADALEREPGDDFLDENDRRIARILELLARGDNAAALEEAEALEASMPDSAVPHNLIGRVHASGGRERRARAAFRQALEIDAGNVAALTLLAELDLQADDIDTARAGLQEALRADDDSEALLLRLAQLEARAGNPTAMLEWLERARTEHPNSAAAVLLLARYRISRAEHELALAELDGLDERQAEQPAALQLEGTSLLALRRYDEAVERFDTLVERQPNVAGWRYLRAQAEAGRNASGNTVRDLDKALELDAEHVPSLLAMTNLEILRGDFEAAEARVDTLRDLIPGRPELDAIVGRLADAREAAASGPADGVPPRLRIDSTEAALTAARDLYGKGQPEQATSLLETWLEANPGDVAVRLTLANTYAGGERGDEAITEYETLLEGDETALPENIRLAALNNLAWYLREDAPERAVDYAERALEVTPDSVATLDTLAMIHFGQGDNAAAKAAFDRAAAIGVDDPTIRFHGAQIEAALGNVDAARGLLAPLVDGEVEFPEAEAAGELLDEIGRSGN